VNFQDEIVEIKVQLAKRNRCHVKGF